MVEIKYLGHSGFSIKHGDVKIVIDPFLTGNPLAKQKPEHIEADYVLISHAHGDHSSDGFSIAARCGATIISCYEIAVRAKQKGIKSHGLHIGGSYTFPFGKIKLTIAHHGSSFFDKTGNPVNLGTPCGFLIDLGETLIYHSGDTGLFLDMKLIGELNKIDIAMLPIGGNYTMDENDALKAVEFLKPKFVIPMHYNTFDLIKADPNDFKKSAASICEEVVILNVGDSKIF